MYRFTTLLILVLAMASRSYGQGPVVYVLQASSVIGPGAMKIAMSEVMELDRAATISCEGPIMKVRISSNTDLGLLLRTLNEEGSVNYTLFQQPGSERNVAFNAFPLKAITTDAAKDEREYKEAKDTWIQAHPDGYQRMTRPSQDEELARPNKAP